MVKAINLALALILIAFSILGLPRIIRIKHITCISDKSPCRGETVEKISKHIGIPIQEALTRVQKELNNNSLIKSSEVKYVFPNSISASIDYKKPALRLKYIGFSNTIVVDESGSIIRTENVDNLPTLLIEGNAGELSKSIPLILNLNKYYGFNYFTLTKDVLSTKTKDDIALVIPTDNDIDITLGSINLTLSQLNRQLQGIRIEEIDFRYKNPIVR